MTDLPMQTVRGYTLQERIGAGGFGAVYRAHQAIVDREVAIKVILPEYVNDLDFIRNFETEARLIARLEHPFIVPLFDYWRDPQGAYLVMRYFGAGSLKAFMKQQGTVPLGKTAQILHQLAGALDTAHRHHVIHRDIKPANVLMDDDENAYLADFGIARQMDTDEPDEQKGFSGTIAYAAPELLQAQPASAQSDIYALGYVAYEMLAGKHAFANQTPMMMLVSHVEQELSDVENVPLAVNAVLRNATAKIPDLRYATARAMAEAFEQAIAQAPITIAPIPIEIINPYKGLRPFEEADAIDFFGRETLVQKLINQFQANSLWRQFLAVVGPSGSGKSSVVHAGLLPALRAGQLEGAENWFIVNMMPGSHPLQQLRNALLSIAIDPTDTLSGKLQTDPEGLVQAVEEVLGLQNNLLLVIDQFEEVFTLVEDENERRQFLDLLYTAVARQSSRLWIVITLRADFYDKPLLYENFGALMQARTQVVLPLSAEELERAITGPVKQVGLEVDTDLVAAIVADVREEPGALPLLQYALTEVFERRTGNRLNLSAYQESGGVLGALARRAEEVYRQLAPEQQSIAQQIFLRLVTLGEGAEDTRRRVRYSELVAIVRDGALLQKGLDAFGKYRLLTFDRDPETREPTIEVAHEALIREWRRLREWLESNRSDIRLQRMLAAAASDWRDANQDKSYLLSGARLIQFEEWSKNSTLALSQQELDFLKASLDERNLREKLESERQAHELRLERRSHQRLQWLVGILVVAAIAGIALTIGIYRQSQAAQRERDNALSAEKEAESLALSTQSQQAFSLGNTTLALLLALEAVNTDNPPQEAYDTLLEVAYAPGVRHVLNEHLAPVRVLAVSPDSQYALSGAGSVIFPPMSGGNPPQPQDGQPGGGLPLQCQEQSQGGQPPQPGGQRTPQGQRIGPPPDLRTQDAPDERFNDNPLILWDIATGQEIRRFEGHQASLSDVLFIPQTEQAVSVSTDGMIFFWDVNTGEIVQQLEVPKSEEISLSVDHHGRLLLVTMASDYQQCGLQILWDIEEGQEIERFEPEYFGLWTGDLTPDASRAIATYWDGSQVVVDVENGQELGRFAPVEAHINPSRFHVAVSPDGETVATSGSNAGVRLWSLATFEEIRTLSVTANIESLAFSANGTQLMILSNENHLMLWNVETGAMQNEFLGDEQLLSESLAVTPNGALVGSQDGSLWIWELDILPANQASHLTGLGQTRRATFLPTDPLKVLSFGGNWLSNVQMQPGLMTWDAVTGEILQHLEGHQYIPASFDVSADGQFAITGTTMRAPGVTPTAQNNLMILWDIETGEKLREFEFEREFSVSALAFDPTSGTQDKPLQAAVGWGQDIRLWNLETDEVLQTFSGHQSPMRALDFSSDGTTILSVSNDDTLRLWSVETGEQILQIALEVPTGFAIYHPTEPMALTQGTDQTLVLWDLTTGEMIQQFKGHVASVEAADFSPDGQQVVASGNDGLVLVWDVESGAEIQRYNNVQDRVWDVRFSPDGSMILGATVGNGIIVWYTETVGLEEAVAWVQTNRYLREFNEFECAAYRVVCE